MYEKIGENANLYIEYTGQKLDAFALGVIQINMNEIVEKIAYNLLSEENLLDLNHTESYPYSS